jgi:predicted peptidase
MRPLRLFLLLASFNWLFAAEFALAEQLTPSTAPTSQKPAAGDHPNTEQKPQSQTTPSLVAAPQTNASANQTAAVVELDEKHLATGQIAVGPLFKDLHFRYTGGGWHNRLIRYRLYVPDDLLPKKKYPMIVWLHGHGDGGNENAMLLNHLDSLIFIPPWHRGQFPFFFLAVECPPDNPLWTSSDSNKEDMNNVVLAAMDKVIAEYPIDLARISLAGLSSGGTGAWDLAARAPQRFSCLAPMASSGGNSQKVMRLVHIPVWAFHSRRDLTCDIRGDRRTVAALKAAGGQACLTEVESTDHDCWHAAFLDYDLLDWLLYQRRGEASDYPPGKIMFKTRLKHFRDSAASWLAFFNPLRWRPWQYTIELGIPILLAVAFTSAWRQRQRRTVPPQP